MRDVVAVNLYILLFMINSTSSLELFDTLVLLPIKTIRELYQEEVTYIKEFIEKENKFNETSGIIFGALLDSLKLFKRGSTNCYKEQMRIYDHVVTQLIKTGFVCGRNSTYELTDIIAQHYEAIVERWKTSGKIAKKVENCKGITKRVCESAVVIGVNANSIRLALHIKSFVINFWNFSEEFPAKFLECLYDNYKEALMDLKGNVFYFKRCDVIEGRD